MSGSVGVLHVSDLHFGMAPQKTLMSAFKKALLDDIRETIDVGEGVELVVFSGDLVQSGSKAEYQALETFLQELWGVFDEKGQRPLLFCVPGNHDLLRPAAGSPYAKAMEHWWDGGDMSTHLFSKDSGYLRILQDAFSNYTSWLDHTSIPLLDVTKGCLPGDVMATYESRSGYKIGLMGLNSSWLQLRGGDLLGKLHVDVEQLVSLCPDPDGWSDRHDATFLITHHPAEWLHPASREDWDSEIHTHERFDFHLFGHMHDQQLNQVKLGGGSAKRSIQAASLFGLELAADGRFKRAHGYSHMTLTKSDLGNELRMWPRKGVKIKGGQHRLVPDVELGLDRSGSVSTQFRSRSPLQDRSLHGSLNRQLIKRLDSDVISRVRKTMPPVGSWSNIRKWEREVALGAISRKERLWVIAEWRMGFEEFLASLGLKGGDGSVFHQISFDLGASRGDLLANVEERYAASLEDICLALSSQASGCLVIEDVGDGTVSPDCELDAILDAVSDYCPDMVLVVKSRMKSHSGSFTEVALKPLDDADGASYIRAWQGGKYSSLGEAETATILRHAGGAPAGLEALLQDFEMFGSRELAALNPDLDRAADPASDRVSPVIMREIDRIRALPKPSKLFSLLQVLAMFPRGESFETIKRFNGPMGFHPQEARELHRLALIDSVPVASLAGDSGAVFQVPIAVREALFSVLGEKEYEKLSSRALELYFGSNWREKGLKGSKIKFQDSGCESWRISNASSMVHRAARVATKLQDARAVAHAMQLTYLYAKALENGDHFRSCAEFLDDVISVFTGFAEKRSLDGLMYIHCKTLRMSGRFDDAVGVFDLIDIDSLNSSEKQGLYYSHAEALRKVDRISEAVDYAKMAIAINAKSGNAIQARSLIVEVDDLPDSDNRLSALEERARRGKYQLTARNIAIIRSYRMSEDDAIEKLRVVQKEARSAREFHNCVRASVRLAKLLIDGSKEVDDVTYRILLDGYHMLHADGANGIFDRLTSVLWDIFARRGDLINQISLFRHSSLRWRLRGDVSAEEKYIKILPGLIDRLRIQGMHERFEVVYVLSRI